MPPEPKPRVDRPSRPEWLSVEAKHEWGRVVPELERLSLLTIVDRAALAAYCTAWGHLVEAERAMQRSYVIRLPTGVEKNGKILTGVEVLNAVGSQWSRYKTAMQQVRAFCVEFGLTPSSRGRMSLPEPKDEDEFEEFLESAQR